MSGVARSETASSELIRNPGDRDFAKPSSERRLFLVDLTTGGVTSFLVAHGRGSDPDH